MGRQGVNIYARGDLQTFPYPLRKLVYANWINVKSKHTNRPRNHMYGGILRSLQGSYERAVENQLEQRHDHYIHNDQSPCHHEIMGNSEADSTFKVLGV
jgi:hypothetical protein